MGRKLKVLEQHFGADYTPVPTILLKGKWLEEAGFQIGEYVEVAVDGDTITITKNTPPESASKKSLEEQIENLTPEKRRKLEKIMKEL